MKFRLSIFFLFSFVSVYAQTEQKLDSLNGVILNAKDSETKLDAYKEILYLESSSNLDNMLISIERIKALHKNESCTACLGVATYWEGLYHYLKGNLEEAIPFFESATEVAREAGDDYTSNRSLTLLSGIYFGLNNYPKAEEYASQLITYGELQKEVTAAHIDGYFMKGLINDDQSYYSLAIANYNKADSLNTVKNGPNFYNYQAKLYNNLSIVFIQIKNFEKAAEYLEKTEASYRKYDNKEGLFSVKQNFGYLEIEQGNYEKAIPLLTETNRFYKELEMKHREGESNYLLGRAYYGLTKYQVAIQHLDQSLIAFKNAGDTLNAGLSHKYLGDSYLRLNNYRNSEENFKEALSIFNAMEAHRNQLNTLKSYSSLYEKTKNHRKALQLFKQFDSINTIFQTKQNEKLVFELDTKYQTEKKQQEITLLTSQNELVKQQKSNQRNLFAGGIGLTTIAGLFFFFLYRNRQKTNKKLQQLDKAKSTFFANISHEFRTPLTLIKGPLEDQLSSNVISSVDRKNLLVAKSNTSRLESLVEQLLALSKLESGNIKLQVQPGNLPQFIAAQAEAFNFSAGEKQIDFRVSVVKDEQVDWFDRDALEKTLFNLIGNAIKYTPENGAIEISTSRQNSQLVLTVTNSGTDLTLEEQEKIFERFYQTNSQNTGTGIGLALTKELVELHKGTISVPTTQKGHTCFKVVLPTSKDKYTTSEILSKELHQIETTQVAAPFDEAESPLLTAEDAPVILIVDDNKDIRNYTASIFESTFNVAFASNGDEGFTQALAKVPDIIISDLMMPKVDGYSFLKMVKENELTFHIPVVLLSAKTEDSDKLKGLEIGADAYITKPFNSQMLLGTVRNLLETRRSLQQRFSQEVILKPKEISISSADEKFIERLQSVFDKQLTNPQFTAELFGKEMGVSRMQLHRKLKALTGQSTTEFIRSQRLKLAMQLLKEKKISISEVGYTVGFNDPSYFTKCFKQEYGTSPSDYFSS